MPLTGKELLKRALKAGWVEDRQESSHHVLEKDGFEPVSIPVHANKDLHKGIESKLLRDLGLKK